MDRETGERNEDNIDRETGEQEHLPYIDKETGEVEGWNRSSAQRTTFRVPKIYRRQSTDLLAATQEHLTTQKISISPALLFLLPTAFCYNALFAIFLGILEVSLHIWAHRKNKKLHGTGIYVLSPLHIITSEFCASCREEESFKKINKLQEKRSKLRQCSIECVRQIVT